MINKIIQDNIQTIIISAVTTIITTIITIFISYWIYNLQENSKLRDKQEQFCIEVMNMRYEIMFLESKLRADCESPSKKCEDTKQSYIEKTQIFHNMSNKALMFFDLDVSSSFIILNIDSLQTYLNPLNQKTDETFEKLTNICIKQVRRTSRLLQ